MQRLREVITKDKLYCLSQECKDFILPGTKAYQDVNNASHYYHLKCKPMESEIVSIELPNNVALDPINPSHYKTHPSGIECIDVTRHMNFNVGNAIKYLWRLGKKGDPIQDVKKAIWYLNDELKRLEKESKW